jgi:cytochrome c peroxidase
MKPLSLAASLLALASAFGAACDKGSDSTDDDLRGLLRVSKVAPLQFPEQTSEMVALGEALFFDKEISGNRDIACATCHHPLAGTGDDLSLSFGTGGSGVGAERTIGEGRGLIPRNAPEVFNRGAEGWTTMFWDNRVSVGTSIVSPAGALLPNELSDVLSIQAMFPPTSNAEMRGSVGDLDVNGQVNELAAFAEDDLTGIWRAIMVRLLAIDEYQTLFANAFPNKNDFGFEHAAMAIAAYEARAFSFNDSPFDRYLAGDNAAMTASAKRGATLFYGRAGCASCHSGPLMTDQLTHNIATPQLGPGKVETGEDFGAMGVTEEEADIFAFRTTPLRNVELTGPWMHAGAYTSLEAAVRHHADPASSLRSYDTNQLDPIFADAILMNEAFMDACIAAIDDLIAEQGALNDEEFRDMMDFMASLTDPAARDMASLIPTSVPSGLPVDGVSQ